MATRGKKISEQTLATSLDGNEIIPFAKNGADGAVKASKIKEYVQPDLTAKQDKLVNSADITVGEDDKLAVTDLAKREVFDDLWVKAAGSNGTVDHTHTEDGVNKPYYLNEVWMTYAEAIDVFNNTNAKSFAQTGVYAGCKTILTHLPAILLPTISLENAFKYCFNIRAVKLVSYYGDTAPITVLNAAGAFKNCYLLTDIDAILNIADANVSDMFVTASQLVNVRLYNLNQNISFADCPLLSLASLQYLVNNAANTSAITVTVHPDAYAKLTGDTTNAAAAALTADELAQWQALVTTANSKNISFATPE